MAESTRVDAEELLQRLIGTLETLAARSSFARHELYHRWSHTVRVTREPAEPEMYNDDYLFAMTRGVADAPIAPAGKVALYVFTVPIDLVLLPFAAIGGLFG